MASASSSTTHSFSISPPMQNGTSSSVFNTPSLPASVSSPSYRNFSSNLTIPYLASNGLNHNNSHALDFPSPSPLSSSFLHQGTSTLTNLTSVSYSPFAPHTHTSSFALTSPSVNLSSQHLSHNAGSPYFSPHTSHTLPYSSRFNYLRPGTADFMMSPLPNGLGMNTSNSNLGTETPAPSNTQHSIAASPTDPFQTNSVAYIASPPANLSSLQKLSNSAISAPSLNQIVNNTNFTKINNEKMAVSLAGVTTSGSNVRGKCNCKASKCLKLYCECLAHGRGCVDCNCVNCHNNDEHDAERREAITAIVSRNPHAFRKKNDVTEAEVSIEKEPGEAVAPTTDAPSSPKDKPRVRGCHCRKTMCMKKYCECFQAGVLCTELCVCTECKNCAGVANLQPSNGSTVPTNVPKPLTITIPDSAPAKNGDAVSAEVQAAVTLSSLLPSPFQGSSAGGSSSAKRKAIALQAQRPAPTSARKILSTTIPEETPEDIEHEDDHKKRKYDNILASPTTYDMPEYISQPSSQPPIIKTINVSRVLTPTTSALSPTLLPMLPSTKISTPTLDGLPSLSSSTIANIAPLLSMSNASQSQWLNEISQNPVMLKLAFMITNAHNTNSTSAPITATINSKNSDS